MRELIPAWPPGASRSIKCGRHPSDAAVDGGGHTGRPAADDDQIVKAQPGRIADPILPATAWLVGVVQPLVRPARSRLAGSGSGRRRSFAAAAGFASTIEPLIGHLIAGQEIPQLVRGRATSGARSPGCPRTAAGNSARHVSSRVAQHGKSCCVRRVPRLHQIVIELDVVDRLDRGVGIGVGGQQNPAGVRHQSSELASNSTPVIPGIR